MSQSSLKIAVSDRHGQSVDCHSFCYFKSHNYGSWLFWLAVYSSNIQGPCGGGVGKGAGAPHVKKKKCQQN